VAAAGGRSSIFFENPLVKSGGKKATVTVGKAHSGTIFIKIL
jgi:hypothetical protein